MVFASRDVGFNPEGRMRHYTVYNTPHPDYVFERRVDLSAFLREMPDVGSTPPEKMPFTEKNVPLMGYVCVPEGDGPFPLALLHHGNYDYQTDSAAGFIYLCELLASHGIVAASMATIWLAFDVDGEGWPYGVEPRIGKRAIYTLEYVKQFRAWNEQPDHPLYGKMDLNSVMLLGHSTSGPDVGTATYINQLLEVPGRPPDSASAYPSIPLDGTNGLGPYGFGIRAIVSIEPRESAFDVDVTPYGNPDLSVDYFNIEASSMGRWQYDTTSRVNPDTPEATDGHIKSQWKMYGGLHHTFNTLWNPDDPQPLPPEDQRTIAKLYIATIALAVLKRQDAYREILRDHRLASAWLPKDATLFSLYQDDQRLFLQHHQEPDSFPEVVISAPFAGRVTTTPNLRAERVRQRYLPYMRKRDAYYLALSWMKEALSPVYTLELEKITATLDRFSVISLGLGQGVVEETSKQGWLGRLISQVLQVFRGGGQPDAKTCTEQPELKLKLVFSDAYGHSVTFDVSEFARILYPEKPAFIQFQSVRIPLARLKAAGVIVEELSSISFVFDGSTPGVLYSNGIQFSL
ncbi:hypothetical protein DCO48_21015 [Pseudomonas sp. SDI]|nr:hypothetical protein DCO48_21015 [Pseudomonas sp. SDI]